MNNLSLQFQLLFIVLRRGGKIPVADLSTKLQCSTSTTLRRISDVQRLLPNKNALLVVDDKNEGSCVIGDCEEIQQLITKLQTNQRYTTWRNREERQLLIVLKLLLSKTGSSKLSVLGTIANVTEATILKDIKRLNLYFNPIKIVSKPGAGTKFVGEANFIQAKLMEFCYGVLSPTNLIALSCDSDIFSKQNVYPCASEIFLKAILDQVDVSHIIYSINAWEKHINIMLSDVAFSNLFLYLVIFELRKNACLMCVKEQLFDAEDSLCVTKLLPKDVNNGEKYLLHHFLLGLEECILDKSSKNVKEDTKDIKNFCSQILAYTKLFISVSPQETLQVFIKSLLLRKNRSCNLFSFWNDEMQTQYNGRLKSNVRFINYLEKVCEEFSYLEWLDLDSLLFILDLFVEEDEENTVEVTLFCVSGVSTAMMMKRMIEKHCPKLKVSKTCSLRNCSSKDLNAKVILSTARSDMLPPHTIIVDSFFDDNQWYAVQSEIFNRLEEMA